jgi:DNA polymerase (family 10)
MLLELKGENPFKIRAYTNAARAIETFGGNVANFQDEEAVAKIPGIGKSIALKIKELAATESLKYLEELSAEFPIGIMELFSLPGLGAKKIKALHDQLGISSIEQSIRSSKCNGRINIGTTQWHRDFECL